MGRFTGAAATFLALAVLSPGQADDPLLALEKDMAARPREAFALARRAADGLQGRPEAVRRLLRTAARIQEDHLAELSVLPTLPL